MDFWLLIFCIVLIGIGAWGLVSRAKWLDELIKKGKKKQ